MDSSTSPLALYLIATKYYYAMTMTYLMHYGEDVHSSLCLNTYVRADN